MELQGRNFSFPVALKPCRTCHYCQPNWSWEGSQCTGSNCVITDDFEWRLWVIFNGYSSDDADARFCQHGWLSCFTSLNVIPFCFVKLLSLFYFQDAFGHSSFQDIQKVAKYKKSQDYVLLPLVLLVFTLSLDLLSQLSWLPRNNSILFDIKILTRWILWIKSCGLAHKCVYEMSPTLSPLLFLFFGWTRWKINQF